MARETHPPPLASHQQAPRAAAPARAELRPAATPRSAPRSARPRPPGGSARRCRIISGSSRPIAAAKRSPGVQREDRVAVGPQHQRRPVVLAQRLEHALAGLGAGGVGRRREHQRERARARLRAAVGERARRRRRSPRRPGRSCTRRARASTIGRSSVRSTKSRNAIHASLICWWPVNSPVSRITSRVDALGVLDGDAQADRPAPVVHDDVARGGRARSSSAATAAVWRS